MEDAPPILKRHGANLPHWRQTGATYAVTFRLADSLPSRALKLLHHERATIAQRLEIGNRQPTDLELRRLEFLYSEKVEEFLDAGAGSCALRDHRAAAIVRDALLHFDRTRYDLLAWCVMPNHVHAVVRPIGGHALSRILHSWKSFTANRINAILNQEGTLWQSETYDHLIRDQNDLHHAIQYVLDNPGKAGLLNWPWVGCSTGFQPVRINTRPVEPASPA